MLDRYLALPKEKDRVQRDESTFMKKILPNLEKFRREDRRITTIERV